MCGLAGKVITGVGEVVNGDIKTMNDKISHRGPDDTGIYISDDHKVGLGNNRLAIIDLSKNGHMPMTYLNKYVITYNGEVYNHQEEREKLKILGYKFSSNSDTEVILALYDKYGTRCLSHLRGMFAFAIYDKIGNIIFLARDRVGKKPLKYFHKNGVFIFASELKAILTQPDVKKQVDYQAIYDYLTFGYVPSPATGFKNIFKLEPASYLIFNIKNNLLVKQSYWHPDLTHKSRLSEKRWEEVILSKLEESVKLRMISDVPIGAMLSGGVDSSAVVAMMAKNSKKAVKTFTIGFKENTYDESNYAKKIAQIFKTDHEELIVNPTELELMPTLAYSFEEPFSNSSAVVAYLICQMARKHVTVILNGDGGDENFAGYDRYRRISRDRIMDIYGGVIKPIAFPTAGRISSRANNFLKKSSLPISERFASYIEIFSELNKNEMLYKTPYLNSYRVIKSAFENSGSSDPREQALYWDLSRYLPDELLPKIDITSMSVGLEARSPLLDRKFIEIASSIPFGLKYKNGVNKYIFKKALESILPHDILYRKKMGFSIPLQNWFLGSLSEYTKIFLLNKKGFVKTVIDENNILDMLSRHSLKTDFGPKLWNLLSLELWYNAYFKNK